MVDPHRPPHSLIRTPPLAINYRAHSHQLRLWFSSVAYVLMEELRRLGLAGTTLAKAQCTTMRLKLLKIGARIRVTSRRVWVMLSSACPYKAVFLQAFENLQASRGSPA